MRTYIIPTSQAFHLAKRMKGKINGFEIIFPDLSRDGKRYFPDGEVYMKILKARKLIGKRVIVLHSGAPKPNEGLIELELILQILRDYNPRTGAPASREALASRPAALLPRLTHPKKEMQIEVFFSYFPYGMQDEVFGKGETNVAENLVEKLVNYYQVKKIYTIDAHFGGRKWMKKYPIKNISAVPILIEKAKKDFGKNILFLSPDIGGQRRTGILGIKKERLTSAKVKIVSPTPKFKGKIIGVIDDMIKTGGTLLEFAEITKRAGAKKLLALVSHGVIPTGLSKVKKKYSKLYLTNTIDQRNLSIDHIDISDLILETISAT